MKFVFASLIFLLSLTISSCMKGESADLVVHNAQIHTLDGNNKVYEAMAIKDGKIIEVGPERQILNKYSAEEYIDAGSKHVYPGFTDAHGHLLSYARQKLSVDLFGCKSYDEMIARIEKYQSKHKRRMIIGRGWDQSLWGEEELPTNERLNEEFPNIPVAMVRIDGHAMLVNDRMLETSDVINTVTKSPEKYAGGHFIYHEDGKPTGMIIDNAMNPILEKMPDFPQQELTATIKEIQNELYSYGITGVHDAGLSNSDFKIIENWVNDDVLNINIYGMLLPDEKNIAFARKNGVYTNKNLLIRSFKVYGDGALGSRGALLKQPYSDRHDHSGHLTTPISEMKRIARICEEIGYQMNSHAIGDSTNRILLEIYKDVYGRFPDYRWRIEHAQVIDPADFDLLASSGAFPSVQPTHATTDQRWAEKRLGKKRMIGAYAYKSILEKCGLMAIGTDFPVEYTDPFRTIHAAINRTDNDGNPAGGFLPSEAITLDECLKGMTLWAAMAAFQEDQLGTLEEGKDATFVIFEEPIAAHTSYNPNFANTVYISGRKVYTVED